MVADFPVRRALPARSVTRYISVRMTFDEFRDTLRDSRAPANLSTPLRALWLDAKDDWKGAHELVDSPRTTAETRVHAYLHRKEGDLSNARYWYRRARVEPVALPLEDEWEKLVREFLAADARQE